MTTFAPISFNAAAESGDRVSANTSCCFALRRRTRGRPIAPVAPAIRILIPLSSQLNRILGYSGPRSQYRDSATTGVSFLSGALGTKRLELLRQLVPRAATIGRFNAAV